MSRITLLQLALSERVALGYVTDYTRYRLRNAGITSAQLEQFFAIAGE